MAHERGIRNIVLAVGASAFLCVAANALAQTTVEPDAAALATPPAAPDAAAPAPAKRRLISRQRSAQIDANEAELRLGRATLERKQGARLLAGEAAGNSASRPDTRYRQRQERLRRMLEQAQNRRDETRGLQ
jgi:hypothetical protein